MTVTNEPDDGENKPELARPKKLELKKTIETGQIRQNFSHGRSKMVQVEVKKKRTFARGATGRMSEVKSGSIGEAVANLEAAELDDGSLSNLTASEREKRLHVLAEAKRAAEDRAIEDAAATAAAEIAKAETEAQAALDAAKTLEAAAAATVPDETEPEPEKESEPAEVTAEATPIPPSEKPNIKTAPEEDARAKKTVQKDATKKPTSRKENEPRRRAGKLTIAEALGDGEERVRSLASVRRARERQKAARQGPIESVKIVREVIVPETITVQELANRMAERAPAVIKTLMGMDVMATINQNIDADTAELVIAEFGHTVKTRL